MADFRARNFFRKGLTVGCILPGLAAAYLMGILVASWTLASFTPAFMPFVTYGDSAEVPADKRPTDRYLSYADGHWYVLHRYRDEVRDEREYRPIPPPDGMRVQRRYRVVAFRADQQQTHVRINSFSAQNPRVAPLPWPESAATWDRSLCKAPPAPDRLPPSWW